MNLIEPTTLALLSKALDASSMRHAVHAQNIANAHAEGYVPQTVSFEEHMVHMRETLARGGSLQASDVADVPVMTASAAAGTRVELDNEVGALSRNTLHYQALLKALDRQLGLVSLALTDGRR
jgi:flagellar basal-body rod protein FlgB